MNRLVSVDSALRLPAAVRAQLTADLENDVADSVNAATTAAAAAVAAADVADTARDEAVGAAASAVAIVTADLDEANAVLIADTGSDTRLAIDAVAGLGGRVIPVLWTGSSWPVRPVTRPEDTVLWIGNPAGAAPGDMVLGDIWTREPLDLDGQWVDWTPSLTAVTTAPTLSEAVGRFVRNGNTITGWARMVLDDVGLGSLSMFLPANVTPGGVLIGNGALANTAGGVTTRYVLGVIGQTGATSNVATFHVHGSTSSMSTANPVALTTGAIIRVNFSYEAVAL